MTDEESEGSEKSYQKSHVTDGSGVFRLLEECNITHTTSDIVINTAEKIHQSANESRRNEDDLVSNNRQQKSSLSVFTEFLRIAFPPPECEWKENRKNDEDSDGFGGREEPAGDEVDGVLS